MYMKLDMQQTKCMHDKDVLLIDVALISRSTRFSSEIIMMRVGLLIGCIFFGGGGGQDHVIFIPFGTGANIPK